MTPVDRLSPVGSAAALGGLQGSDAGTIARGLMTTVGDRLSAWSAQVFGGGAPSGGSFAPDTAELARGGDVYGLRSLVSDAAARFGAGPADEGALLRAAEDFTRAAALHAYAGDRGSETVNDALTGASSDRGGLDGVIDRIETATRELRASAGT